MREASPVRPGTRKVACCYWEGARPPAYLAWCVSSWLNYLDLDDVLFLNQSNIHLYLGDLVDLSFLRRFSFAKQSDIVSAAYLYKYGGIFLDIDSIFVNQGALDFVGQEDGADVFTYFGNSETNGVHIGVIGSPARGTVVTRWQNGLFERTAGWREDRSWSYVGNSILEPIIHSPVYAGKSRCVDVKEGLATPESVFASPELKSARERYEGYWFEKAEDGGPGLSEIVLNSAGIVCLHNSWTPRDYSAMTMEELLVDDRRLSELLRTVGRADAIDTIQSEVYLGG